MLDKTYIKPDKYGLSVSPLDRPKNNCSPFRAQQKLAAREKILEQKLIKQALADPDFAKLLLDQANIDLERAMGLHTRYINWVHWLT